MYMCKLILLYNGMDDQDEGDEEVRQTCDIDDVKFTCTCTSIHPNYSQSTGGNSASGSSYSDSASKVDL